MCYRQSAGSLLPPNLHYASVRLLPGASVHKRFFGSRSDPSPVIGAGVALPSFPQRGLARRVQTWEACHEA